MAENERNEADTLRILIATDNHVGYQEKDPIRGDDSFDTFEEILKLAQAQQVDTILLGGDLFHDNRPSRKCMHTMMKLLRRYCMGDKPCSIYIASDQSVNFPDEFASANYLDPNYNVSLPIFSIHGNHDDPSGDGNLCALDLLSVSGLVNYFGKSPSVDNVEIQPILLTKGDTKLALYGLGNIRDERLHRSWRSKNVRFIRPAEQIDEWFNLLVLHQNRTMHSSTNYIPEAFLDEFLDLVIWGHEHECLIEPSHTGYHFQISQPGSSIATSLCEGEAVPKHVAILQINKLEFSMEKLRLKTVRPFQMSEVVLSDVEGLSPSDGKKCHEHLIEVVNELIRRAELEWEEVHAGTTDLPTMPLPLIRLKVEYSGGFEAFNPHRFGQQFVDKVANPKEVLKFYRKRRAPIQTNKKSKNSLPLLNDLDAAIPERLDLIKVEDLVQQFLTDLDVLPEKEFEDAVKLFIDKDDRDAIKEFVDGSVNRLCSSLETNETSNEEDLRAEAAKDKQRRADIYAKENASGDRVLMAKRKYIADDEDEQEGSEIDDERSRRPAAKRGRGTASRGNAAAASTSSTGARGRGRGRGRGRQQKRGAASARANEEDDAIQLSSDEIEVDPPSPPPPSRQRQTKLTDTSTRSAAGATRAVPSTSTSATHSRPAEPSRPAQQVPSVATGRQTVAANDSDDDMFGLLSDPEVSGSQVVSQSRRRRR
jgi:double-strand break repair protein MRE11